MTFTPTLLAPVFYEGDVVNDVDTSFPMSKKMESHAKKHGFNRPFYGLAGEAWIVEINGELVCATGEEAKELGYTEDVSLEKREKNGKIFWVKHEAK